MADQDDIDLPSLETLESQIRRDLAMVQQDLDALLSSEPAMPEPEVDEGFTANVSRIEETMGDLRRALDRLTSVGPVDLSKIASKVLSELLLDLEKPLVLTVQWDEALAKPTVAAEALSSVIGRMMRLVVRIVEPGDGIRIQTLREDDDAVLRIEVDPSDPWGRPQWVDELSLRCRSVGDFVEELGGRFDLDVSDGLLLELRLDLIARVR